MRKKKVMYAERPLHKWGMRNWRGCLWEQWNCITDFFHLASEGTDNLILEAFLSFKIPRMPAWILQIWLEKANDIGNYKG